MGLRIENHLGEWKEFFGRKEKVEIFQSLGLDEVSNNYFSQKPRAFSFSPAKSFPYYHVEVSGPL